MKGERPRPVEDWAGFLERQEVGGGLGVEGPWGQCFCRVTREETGFWSWCSGPYRGGLGRGDVN